MPRVNSFRSAKVQLHVHGAVSSPGAVHDGRAPRWSHELLDTADGSRLDVAMGRGADAMGGAIRRAINDKRLALIPTDIITLKFEVKELQK